MTFKDAREVLKLLWSMAGTVTQVPWSALWCWFETEAPQSSFGNTGYLACTGSCLAVWSKHSLNAPSDLDHGNDHVLQCE
jgi:hypothetical protein